MNVLISLFAGIGLLFIGSQFLGVGIRQLVGMRVRAILAKVTEQKWRSILAGIGVGALLQNANTVTFLAASLVGAGSLTIESGNILVAWSYVGTAVRLFAAAIDLHAVTLIGVGLVGLGYYAGWDKDPVKRNWVSAVLGLALLMLGIEMMIDGTAPLRDAGWVRDLLLLADRFYPIGFVIGTVLSLATQGMTLAMIVIGLARGGLLDMDQAALLVAGALLGSGILSWLQATNLRGAERQLSVQQLVLRIIGTVVLLPLLMIEHFFNLPTVVAATQAVSNEISIQLIFLWWVGGLVPAIMILPFDRAICRLLARVSPPTERDSLVRPIYIFPQAAAEPSGALDLARREQSRVFAVLPMMLEPVREGGRIDVDLGEVKSGSQILLAQIDDFLAATMMTSPDQEVGKAIMSAQYINQLLREALETAGELVSLVMPIRAGAREIDIFSDLIEPLHVMTSTSAERMVSGRPGDIEIIAQLGRPRDELLNHLRNRVLASGAEYSRPQQEAFYKATRLFERIIWLIRRIATSLADVQHVLMPENAAKPEEQARVVEAQTDVTAA